MSFEWGHFTGVSRELLGAPPDPTLVEARERSAISRSYYALFQVVLVKATKAGLFFPKYHGADHENLRNALASERTIIGTRLARNLEDLHRARLWADYKSGSAPRGQPVAKDCVRIAEQAIVAAAGLSV